MLTNSNIKTALTISLASFAVISQWGFWTKGVYAIGINAALVGLGFWLILIRTRTIPLSKKDCVWLLPLWLVILSFALFENPWLKLISMLMLPLATGIVYSFRQTSACDEQHWNSSLVSHILSRAAHSVNFFGDAWFMVVSLLKKVFGGTENTIVLRVVSGVTILAPVAVIVLFLLSSADANFLKFIGSIYDVFWENVSFTFFFKIILIFVTTTVVLSMLLGWQDQSDHESDELSDNKLDDIVAGVVVSGVLLIYIVFLCFQVEYLLLKRLPLDFVTTEKIVKSGFWQLLFLSVLNAVMFFVVYKNTTIIVQYILRVFILASGLVLLSACWRIALYVYWYGLSYEKFFASYTAFYALLVFAFLVTVSLSEQRKNIFKFIALSSLWFYSIASVLPIEKTIFNTNIFLSQKSDTRINFYHLTVLSVDVLGDVQKNIELGMLDNTEWRDWLVSTQDRECNGDWYELNLSRLLNCKK